MKEETKEKVKKAKAKKKAKVNKKKTEGSKLVSKVDLNESLAREAVELDKAMSLASFLDAEIKFGKKHGNPMMRARVLTGRRAGFSVTGEMMKGENATELFIRTMNTLGMQVKNG